jgi:hypothetical protein
MRRPHTLQVILAAGNDGDTRPFTRKCAGACQPYAFAAARDQHYLALQFQIHAFAPG